MVRNIFSFLPLTGRLVPCSSFFLGPPPFRTEQGYGISFGYVSTDGTEIALGSGNRQPANVPKAPNVPSGTVNKFDTFQMGSGTKPFTATVVMQLVEEGKVRLGDLVQEHVDGPMQRMWNTSFVALFGPPAVSAKTVQCNALLDLERPLDAIAYCL